MAYTKTTWSERKGTNLNKFNKSAETGTSVILTNAPDAISQPGTPFSVENMNHLEQGIYEAHEHYNVFHRIGEFHYFGVAPTVAEFALWRMLPLQGQVIQVTQYAELCARMWVGSTANATADWWYKTSDAAGNTRDPNGAYMRVLDHQGLFSRGAGQNSKYRMANTTPYDGKSIGAFGPDMFQGHWHSEFYTSANNITLRSGTGPYLNLQFVGSSGGSDLYIIKDAIDDNMHGPARYGSETVPASLSAFICITY